MDWTTLPVTTWLLLALAGLAGGWIDSIAGGGGLITVPALLACGLPPPVALGTNKLQSSCGTLLAVYRYRRAGLLTTPSLPWAVTAAALAGSAGAWTVGKVGPDLLRAGIPWLLAALTVYTALQPHFGLKPRGTKCHPVLFAGIAGWILGFYDGFFGPGTGSFWMLALVTLQGLDLRHATGYTKAANLASNAGALAVFAWGGSLHGPIALVMIAGQLVGAWLGSAWVIHDGLRIIRPVFLGVAAALTLKLMWDWLAPELQRGGASTGNNRLSTGISPGGRV